MKKAILMLICTLTLALVFTGCFPFEFGSSSSEDDPIETVPSVSVDSEDMFTDKDSTAEYDEEESTFITLNNESVRITQEGTYILSGSIEDGQIVVDCEDEKVQLVLNGVTISSSNSAPLYVIASDKVYVSLNEGTENTLSTTGEYEDVDGNGIDAVIFSKGDLSFNGFGTLTINADYGHGICGKDDVIFTSGTYNIESENHGIRANDSIRIAGGTFNIESGKDAIKCSSSDENETELGYIYIADGTFKLDAMQDGLSASSTLLIDNGYFNISSGGGFVKVLNSITLGEGSSGSQVTDSLTTSMKAMKANDIEINDGTYYMSCYEDAMHANNDLFTINGGTFTIYTGDDGVHSDNNLVINGGTIDIIDGYEGIEGANITINGGTISVDVLDDAVNVSHSSGVLTITGGHITLKSQGDGVDSNGSFVMTGGTLVLDIDPIYSGGDGNFDITGSITYTGGTITDASGNDLDPNDGLSSGGQTTPSFPGRW